jgi:WhiB family redox-sensing transcriptional regulator
MSGWWSRAACRHTPPDAWFPPATRRYGIRAKAVRLAVTVCRACPVRAECAQEAIDHDERAGIWGGVDLGDDGTPRTAHTTKALRRAARP